MPNPLDALTPQDFLTELAAFRLELDAKQSTIERQRGEIERLREALKRIEDADLESQIRVLGRSKLMAYRSGWLWAKKIARAALEQEQK